MNSGSRDAAGEKPKQYRRDNVSYVLNLNYDNGSLLLPADYSRLAHFHESARCRPGKACRFEPVKIGTSYGRTGDRE